MGKGGNTDWRESTDTGKKRHGETNLVPIMGVHQIENEADTGCQGGQSEFEMKYIHGGERHLGGGKMAPRKGGKTRLPAAV